MLSLLPVPGEGQHHTHTFPCSSAHSCIESESKPAREGNGSPKSPPSAFNLFHLMTSSNFRFLHLLLISHLDSLERRVFYPALFQLKLFTSLPTLHKASPRVFDCCAPPAPHPPTHTPAMASAPSALSLLPASTQVQ